MDKNQALGEQFRGDDREWRILDRLLMIIFASAKLTTIIYNMSLLATWKRKKNVTGRTWVFHVISKVSGHCLMQAVVLNSLLVKEDTAWEFLRRCYWSELESKLFLLSVMTASLHCRSCHYTTIFSWVVPFKHNVMNVWGKFDYQSLGGRPCYCYLCIYIVAEGVVRTVGSSSGSFPNRRALCRFSTVSRSWCDTELWKRIRGGNLQQSFSESSYILFAFTSF